MFRIYYYCMAFVWLALSTIALSQSGATAQDNVLFVTHKQERQERPLTFYLGSNTKYSTFYEALQIAGLADTLESSFNRGTVLAPSNLAISDDVPAPLWRKYTTNPDYILYHLRDLLLYHIVPNHVLLLLPEDNDDTATTSPEDFNTWNPQATQGEDSFNTLIFQAGMINGGDAIVVDELLLPEYNTVEGNVTAIYGIDAVLPKSQLLGTIVEYLQLLNDESTEPNIYEDEEETVRNTYNILLTLLEATGYLEQFSDFDTTTTMFVPSDSKLKEALELDDVQEFTKKEVETLLQQHFILEKNLQQTDWANQADITMESGEVFPVQTRSIPRFPTRLRSTIANVLVSKPNVFVTNGILHFIDGVFGINSTESTINASTVVPTTANNDNADDEDEETTPAPTQVTTATGNNDAEESSTGSNTAFSCDICNGGTVDPALEVNDGTSCVEWAAAAVTTGLAANKESCLMHKIIAATSCGCTFPTGSFAECSFCSRMPMDSFDFALPDYPLLTCQVLQNVGTVDSEEMCNLLLEKYGSYCSCQGSPNPACTLCEIGRPMEDTSYPLSPPRSTTGDSAISSGPSCFEAFSLASVQSADSCGSSTVPILGSSPVDMAAFCCPRAELPNHCGDLCRGGFPIPEDNWNIVFDPTTSITCRQVEETFPYFTEAACPDFANATDICCTEQIDTAAPSAEPYDNEMGQINESETESESGSSCEICAGVTVGEIAGKVDTLAKFDNATRALNIDKLLLDKSLLLTVFAPNDDAFKNDDDVTIYINNMDFWSQHAASIFENHITEGKVSTSDLFFGSNPSATTLAGENLRLDREEITIGGQEFSIVNQNLEAENGYVHEIKGFLHPNWLSMSIIDILEERTPTDTGLQDPNAYSALLELLEQTSLTVGLQRLASRGMTLLAPVNRAFVVIDEDGENGDRGNELLYHILDTNAYTEQHKNESFYVMSTRHPFADVLITQGKNGLIRYNNDDSVISENLANNGVIHEVGSFLVPPTLVSFLGYANDFAGLQLGILRELVATAGWEEGPLSLHMGLNETDRLIFFVPVDQVFVSSLGTEGLLSQLLTPVWARHLEYFLKNLISSSSDSAERVLSKNAISFSTIGGTTVPFGSFDIKVTLGAVDGTAHILDEGSDMTFALQKDIYQHILDNLENATGFGELLAENLSNTEKNYEALTVLVPPDSSWEEVVASRNDIELAKILENHIFEGLVFSEDLLDVDGALIESINGEQWVVSNLDGEVYLNNAQGGETARVLPASEALVSNGVVHLLDSALVSSSKEGPCMACNGPMIRTAALPDGTSCESWALEVSNLERSSEQCLLERALAIKFCGCASPVGNETVCELCSDSEITGSLKLPDGRGLTCNSIGGLLSADGPLTCNVLSNKYSKYCGCEGAAEQGLGASSCSFCKSGVPQSKPFIIPNVTFSGATKSMFGNPVDGSCLGFARFFFVQSSNACPDATKEWIDDVSWDVRAWCECPNAVTQKPCGNLCALGTNLQAALVVDTERELTCEFYSSIFDYAAGESSCEDASDLRTFCCSPSLVTIEPSFVVYNEENLGALAFIGEEETVNAAFEDFVEDLVRETESFFFNELASNIEQQENTTRQRRKMLTSLQPKSIEIHTVRLVSCPAKKNVPANAVCHNVYGKFNLIPENEEPASVQERYENAVNASIEDGSLQASFDAIDPVFPFKIGGLEYTDQTEVFTVIVEENSDSSWYLYLLIALAGVFWVCVLGLFACYCRSRKWAKGRPADVTTGKAPIREVSVLLENEGHNGGNLVGCHNFRDEQKSKRLGSTQPYSDQDIVECAINTNALDVEFVGRSSY